jgi:hypothetical protein
MIQGTELIPGVWVLHNGESDRNTGAIFDVEGEGPVVGVDPGDLPVELDALDRFATEMGRTVGGLIFTAGEKEHPARDRWPGAVVITPATIEGAPLLPPPVSGWEMVSLSPGRAGVYQKKAGILFSGDLLRDLPLPNLAAGADAYLEALEGIEALDPKVAIPSQGNPAQGKREVRARIAADRDYTQNLVRHVLTSRSARLPLERVLSVARDIYEDYPFLDAHLRNLESVWREFGST